MIEYAVAMFDHRFVAFNCLYDFSIMMKVYCIIMYIHKWINFTCISFCDCGIYGAYISLCIRVNMEKLADRSKIFTTT